MRKSFDKCFTPRKMPTGSTGVVSLYGPGIYTALGGSMIMRSFTFSRRNAVTSRILYTQGGGGEGERERETEREKEKEIKRYRERRKRDKWRDKENGGVKEKKKGGTERGREILNLGKMWSVSDPSFVLKTESRGGFPKTQVAITGKYVQVFSVPPFIGA